MNRKFRNSNSFIQLFLVFFRKKIQFKYLIAKMNLDLFHLFTYKTNEIYDLNQQLFDYYFVSSKLK
jgi:hypothetical protein